MSDFPHEIFKAYDIRGVVDTRLTHEIVKKIGQAFGSEVIHCGGRQVVIGRDGRLSGPTLSGALVQGLIDSGVNIVDIGLAPSPLVYYASHVLNAASCIAITGSHNPPEYNGLKCVVEGVTLSAERIQALKHRILSGDLSHGRGTYQQQAVLERYVDDIRDRIQPQRTLKVVIDCGNGVAGLTAPAVFQALGCELIELYSEVDGTFPNHHPDPSNRDNLKDLIATVESERADIGLAFDGDGDRLGVISGSGNVIWADRQMILFARDILARSPGASILYDVKCTRQLPIAIREAGGKDVMWRTGHSFMKAKLKETQAALAGEMSGHLFFNDQWFGFDDGVYAGARLIEVLSRQAESPSAVLDALPNSVNTPELHITFAEGEHVACMRKLEDCAEFKDGTVTTIDGIRVDFEDGFGLIRPSNTTPVLVLRFEGDTQDALSKIQRQFANWLHTVDPDLTLPF